MPPTLLAPDRQTSYMPVWFAKCPQWPRTYATRDVDVPLITPGVGFNVGDSVVGGDDLVGGGAGPLWRQAYRGILNTPVVTRKIGEPQWPMVDVQDVTVEIAHDGELLGDWRGAPFTLSAYDAYSGWLLLTGAFVVFQAVHSRGVVTITGKNVDLSILEAQIPKGLITTAEFPLAAPDAIGTSAPWVIGNVTNLPLPCVRDDQVRSQFDYVCRDTLTALTGLRRVMPGGVNPFVALDFEGLEPYPGQDGVGVNLGFEDFDAGATSVPTGWALSGAGATVAKNITAGQFTEGSASVTITTTGVLTRLTQNLMTNAPQLPLSWWRGREATIVGDVRTATAARVVMRLADGVQTIDSTFHTGGSTFEALVVGTVAVPFIIDAAATVLSLTCTISGGGGTPSAQFDNIRVYLKAKNWNECLRHDLYPGYTALRAFLRQEDSSGSLFTLVADVHGAQPERNPIRAIRTIASSQAHALGKTVDPVTFDAEETKLCFVYDDAVRLDGPQLYLSFQDALDNALTLSPEDMEAKDRSGYNRHAAYTFLTPGGYKVPGPSGAPNDAYIDGGTFSYFEAPYDVRAGFDTADAHTFEIWYYINSTVVSTGGFARPICEKRIGLAAKSGRFLSHESSSFLFGVMANGGTLFTASAALTAPAHTQTWLHIVATAVGGVLAVTVRTLAGTVTASGTGTYLGALDTGDGVTAVFKWGTGLAIFNDNWYTRFAMFSSALPAARAAAHVAALPFEVEPIVSYDAFIAAHGPSFNYRLVDPTGDVVMADDTGLNNGVFNGGVLLGPTVANPLPYARGFVNSYTAARFQNDISKYGVRAGMALTDSRASILLFYRPTALQANAGICEKTIGGVRGTQWGFCQRMGTATQGAVRFTIVAASGTHTLDAPILAEDVGRYMWLVADWSVAGVVRLYKNGVLVTSTTVTPPMASGVGDFYVGCQGTNGGGLTRPAQGDIGRISYHAGANVFDTTEIANLWLAATWYNGGLVVDAALREPRAARAWLEQICVLRGIRLGMTPDGPITITCDAAPATTIRLHARDGAGDGERTIKAIGDSTYGPLDEAVADVVVRGRRDLLSNTWLVERRRTVHSTMGQDKAFELDCVREYPALDRVAAYLASIILDGEHKVDVTMGQAARSLMEAELVMVTDALMGLDAEIMEAQQVEKSLPTTAAKLRGWSEDRYTWDPSAFPSGSGPG